MCSYLPATLPAQIGPLFTVRFDAADTGGTAQVPEPACLWPLLPPAPSGGCSALFTTPPILPCLPQPNNLPPPATLRSVHPL
jgi:hypothetical protein